MTVEKQPASTAASEFLRRLTRDETLTDDELRHEIETSVAARAQQYLDQGLALDEAAARAESEWYHETLLVYTRGIIALVQARRHTPAGETPLDPPTKGNRDHVC